MPWKIKTTQLPKWMNKPQWAKAKEDKHRVINTCMWNLKALDASLVNTRPLGFHPPGGTSFCGLNGRAARQGHTYIYILIYRAFTTSRILTSTLLVLTSALMPSLISRKQIWSLNGSENHRVVFNGVRVSEARPHLLTRASVGYP